MEFKRIAIDTSKHVFTWHGVDAQERVVLRRELRRQQLEAFFAKLPPTAVVLQACGGSHHWGRRLAALGHRVRLIPPQYVKPFVKRAKNDRIDAEAISAAAARPSRRFVPVKTAEAQAAARALSVRELLVKQRTQLVNALRGHAAEFGISAAKGLANAAALVEVGRTDPAVPAREMGAWLGEQVAPVDAELAKLDRKLAELHAANPVSQLLAAVPGVGPVGALTVALTVDAPQFRAGRHFAAWLGLTPKEHSTGGKQRLAGISRAGTERLRPLLVLGATAVIRVAKPGNKHATPGLTGVLARRPRMVAAVALANTMARIAWAMMARGEASRQAPKQAPAVA